MVLVVFRKDNNRLASMCMQKFRSTNAAKKHIEEDAQHICKRYDAFDLGWIKPNTLDYYCVELKSGVKCYWQYFEM